MAWSDGRKYIGRVRQWDKYNGWGIVDSDSFDDPIWVHYSSIDPTSWGVLAGGFLHLYAGDEVELIVEHAEQDEFHLRAVWVKSTNEGGNEPKANG
ncbi:cold shock domain-containing protein [Amycolatopsis sp. NPDC051372]|uniref:cold shock domain-containing protein n=1 Tax=Amycolatopsis sp. NPDC051372 TaxID=3155669 RepID=UPI00344A3156